MSKAEMQSANVITSIAQPESSVASLLSARLLPLIPPLALLLGIRACSVNVPYGTEWDLIPVVESLRNGKLGWTQFLSGPMTAMKAVATPLALITNFDVRTSLYTAFVFQLLAFILLWSVLELSLRSWHQKLIAPLAIVLALLMFPPAAQLWLSSETSLENGIRSLSAAVIVWLLARWTKAKLTVVLCLFITLISMHWLPAGALVWGIVSAAILTRSWMGSIRWQDLRAWGVGTLVLSAPSYFGSFGSTAGHLQFFSFLAHPFQLLVSTVAYIGWPLTQTPNLWIAGGTGVVGIALCALAVSASRHDRTDLRAILPWLWLSSYGLISAIFVSAGRTEGPSSAPNDNYAAASLFWIGFAVIAAVTLWKPSQEPIRGERVLRTVSILAVMASCTWLYACGYVGFGRYHQERVGRLMAIYSYSSMPDDVLGWFHPDHNRKREYLEVLAAQGLGPFAPHMSTERQRLENETPLARLVIDGQGSLDLASCSLIAGWGWDRQQPDSSVKVEIYDDEALLKTIPAPWFRTELLGADIGNGRHSFFLETPTVLKDGQAHTIRARFPNSKEDLFGSPKQIMCP
jgi:hypothetical protein